MARLLAILRFFNLMDDDVERLSLTHMLVYVATGLLIYTVVREPSGAVTIAGAIAAASGPAIAAFGGLLPAILNYREKRSMRQTGGHDAGTAC